MQKELGQGWCLWRGHEWRIRVKLLNGLSPWQWGVWEGRIKFPLSILSRILHLCFDVCTWSCYIQQVKLLPGLLCLCPSSHLPRFYVDLSVSLHAIHCSPSHVQLNKFCFYFLVTDTHTHSQLPAWRYSSYHWLFSLYYSVNAAITLWSIRAL